MDDLIPFAKYVVTHPYGVTDELDADEDGRVFWTTTAASPTRTSPPSVLAGRVAPFLQRDTGAPVGYLGDPRVEHTVTGSPFGTNFFRVRRSPRRRGPRATGTGRPGRGGDRPVRRSGQDRHSSRRRRRARGVPAARAGRPPSTCSPPARPGRRSSSAGTVLPRTTFVPDPAAGPISRAYTVRVAAAAGPPGAVDVLNVSDQPATRISVPVTDQVTVTRAEFDVAAGRLDRGGAVVRRPGPRPGRVRRRPRPAGADRADNRLALRPPRDTGHDPGPLRGRRLHDHRGDADRRRGRPDHRRGRRGRAGRRHRHRRPGPARRQPLPRPGRGLRVGHGRSRARHVDRGEHRDADLHRTGCARHRRGHPDRERRGRGVGHRHRHGECDPATGPRAGVDHPRGVPDRQPAAARGGHGDRRPAADRGHRDRRRGDRGRSPVDATRDWSVRTTLAAARPGPTVGDEAVATTGGGAQASLPIRIRN